MTQRKRILFISNHGSLGDMHPFLGAGRALQAAGHEVTVAASKVFVPRVQAAGLPVIKVGQDFDPSDPGYMEPLLDALLDVRAGPLRLLQQHVFPSFEQLIEECLPLARKADLLVAGALGYFVPTLSELCHIPWAQLMIAPLLYWSAYDPPLTPALPFLRSLPLGPRGYKLLYRAMFSALARTASPLQAARRARGLRPGPSPFQPEGRNSPYLNIATFSKHFAPAQPDWPRPLIQTGFFRYDGTRQNDESLEPELGRFLDAGTPPIMITLGSGASVFRPGNIYECFAEALARLPNQRGVMLVGSHAVDKLRARFSHPKLFVSGYAPFGQLMPRCRAIVHQGGIGTTGHALEAGVPSVVIGHVNDQLDNARHVVECGAGLSLKLRALTAKSLHAALQRLCTDPRLAGRARQMSQLLLSEDPDQVIVRGVADFFAGRSGALNDASYEHVSA